jgi:hypothetical protein
MPEAVTKHHKLDWVVRVDISLLPEDAPACSVCCPACATGRRAKCMKIPFEMPRWRLRDNIKTDLKEIGCDAVDMVQLTRTRIHWRVLANV